MSYSGFTYSSIGKGDGQITSTSSIETPVRALGSPGNLWVRVTGIAQAVRDDPPWGDNPPVLRGVLTATTDPIFNIDDKLIVACATAAFARIDRDENEPPSSDDWGMALDEIASVDISAGRMSLVVHAAYQGDTEIRAIAFSADLLIFRPSLLLPVAPSDDLLRKVLSDRVRELHVILSLQ
jgi:hypothetical protein